MAFCKFCGKELGEDNKCTCAEFQDNERSAEIFNNVVVPGEDKPIKRGGTFKYLLAFLIFLAVGAIVIMCLAGANSYKTPIKSLAKGIRKADSSRIIESMYTETTVAEITLKAKENGLTWNDYLKQNDKAIESAIDGMGIKRLKVDILAKEKLSGSNFDNIEKYYNDTYGLKAKKAYRVEVEFAYKQDGEKIPPLKGWLCVVKLKGEGWKFCPKYSPDSFEFIDKTIYFE
ncbi:MAG: hypothetical protein IKK66_01635 [Ruminococcus sp.]|nr:hypothetical protein [Ruminococcus sp.]